MGQNGEAQLRRPCSVASERTSESLQGLWTCERVRRQRKEAGRHNKYVQLAKPQPALQVADCNKSLQLSPRNVHYLRRTSCTKNFKLVPSFAATSIQTMGATTNVLHTLLMRQQGQQSGKLYTQVRHRLSSITKVVCAVMLQCCCCRSRAV